MLSPITIGAGLCVLLFTACGQKPDGTPYGVDPGKLPEGRTRAAASRTPKKPRFRGNKIPKAGEFNAVTNGARSGQPLTTPYQQAAAAE